VAETAVKRLLLTGKAMGQVYQCWWRVSREINVFFQVRMCHILFTDCLVVTSGCDELKCFRV
jgi:hypothetical protein